MDDQNSRQQRRSFVGSANSAVSAGRRIYSLTNKARTAGILAANPEVWAVIGGVALIVLIVFAITFSTGEAANLPTDTNSGQGSQTSAPVAPAGGKCSAGSNLCSPQNMSAFGTNANTASIICNAESSGQSNIINSNCLKGITADYSVGLFQINAMAHCPNISEIFSCVDGIQEDGPNCPGRTYCVVKNQDLLNDCVNRFSNIAENIKKAMELSRGGSYWNPWGAAYACGIL